MTAAAGDGEGGGAVGHRAHECGAEVEDEVGDEICVDDPLEDRPARAEGNIDLEAHTVRNLRRHVSTLGQAASDGENAAGKGAEEGTAGKLEQPEGGRTENET